MNTELKDRIDAMQGEIDLLRRLVSYLVEDHPGNYVSPALNIEVSLLLAGLDELNKAKGDTKPPYPDTKFYGRMKSQL